MAFLDEEEALEAPEEFEEFEPELRATRPPRPGRPVRQQILIRRAVAAGGALLFVILIVLLFRGCVEARKDRAINNFISDVSALAGESEQVGESFFGLLEDAGGRTELEYEAEVKSFRGASETLLDRAQGLDAPDEMKEAKESIILTLELRRNALTSIGNNIGPALGKENATDAQQAISDQMRLLFASDAVYSGVAQPEMASVLKDEGLEGSTSDCPSGSPAGAICLPSSQFMPEPPEEWLDLAVVTDALAQVTGDETTTTGVRGLEINMTTIGDTQLLPDQEVTVSAADPAITVEILNGGESEETDVTVNISIGGTELPPQTIPRIASQQTVELKDIPIAPVPASGEETTIEVTVEPVPGEEVTDNNTSNYPVIFE